MQAIDGSVPVLEFCEDSLFPERRVTLGHALITGQGRLEVKLADEVLEFPVDWLRNNCECVKCFNPYCLSYISTMKNIVYEAIQLDAVDKTEDSVKCKFTDGHVTEYTAGWLYNRRMTREGIEERSDCLSLHSTKPWPEPADVVVKRATYKEVTETSEGFQRFADSLIIDGIFIISGAPNRYIYDEFGEKTRLPATTNHYGAMMTVKHEPSPISFAYTAGELEVHVDQPYMINCPQIQLLHCLVQADNGGENVMVDGIKAANVLRERNPEYFKILTTRKLSYNDLIAFKDQPQYYQTNCAPVINLDEDGEPAYIRWSNNAHSSFFEGSVDDYETFMRAFKEFYKILYDGSINIKTQPGDILVFDNKRVMHGRLAYDSTQARQLELWYIEWDSLYSRLRVDKTKKSLG